MSHKPDLNKNGQQRSPVTLPDSGKREFLAIRRGASFRAWENWLDEELKSLLDDFAEFETPASRRRFFVR